MSFWDDRYNKNTESYGIEPNFFLKKYIDTLDIKGSDVLFPGEGEERNSLYTALKGAHIFCFDSSDVAKKHALKKYRENNIQGSYENSSYSEYLVEKKFDYIFLIYCHCMPNIAKKFYANMEKSLKAGAKLYCLGYTKKQLGMTTGGPKNLEMLYSEDLEKEFNLNLVSKKIFEADVQEGAFHDGKSHLIELVLQKKAPK